MTLLLDAHALLWWLADDPELTPAARTAIADPAAHVLVSAATIWEIEIKRALGKLAAPTGLVRAVDEAGFDILPITGTDAEAAAALPPLHRDPFDRMLVAQAQVESLALVSCDSMVARYEVEVVW